MQEQASYPLTGNVNRAPGKTPLTSDVICLRMCWHASADRLHSCKPHRIMLVAGFLTLHPSKKSLTSIETCCKQDTCRQRCPFPFSTHQGTAQAEHTKLIHSAQHTISMWHLPQREMCRGRSEYYTSLQAPDCKGCLMIVSGATSVVTTQLGNMYVTNASSITSPRWRVSRRCG